MPVRTMKLIYGLRYIPILVYKT